MKKFLVITVIVLALIYIFHDDLGEFLFIAGFILFWIYPLRILWCRYVPIGGCSIGRWATGCPLIWFCKNFRNDEEAIQGVKFTKSRNDHERFLHDIRKGKNK